MLSNGVVAFQVRVGQAARSNNGRNSRTHGSYSDSLEDGNRCAIGATDFRPVNVLSGEFVEVNGQSVEVPPGWPRISHTEVNTDNFNVESICTTCATANCAFACTNGSNSNDYGFIPLQPLRRLVDHGFNHNLNMGYLGMHELLCKSVTQNCISPQIRIPTDLNIPLWESLLQGNRDHQLIFFLKYGFPLDLSQSLEFEPQTFITNHSSALQHSECIQNYLDVEIKHKAIMGPFRKPPIPALHCSPLLTRPKAGSTTRRVIVDLSWPHGNSVNHQVCSDTYMGSVFKLTFPTVDDIVSRVAGMDGKCLLYKIDLQRAFRHLKLDPRDINRTGLQFQNQYYVDTAVPFGYRHGSVCMQRVTDSIRGIMHKNGYYITNYIDDLIGCDTPEVAVKAYEFLKSLIVQLGLVISENKLFPPQTCIPCLGIDIDVISGIMSIPEEKLTSIITMCAQWGDKVKTHKKALQSLAGSLLYIHKCVHPARLFINRVLATLREAPETGPILLSVEFHKDIAWFNRFLPLFNGKVYFKKHLHTPITNVFVDASLTGVGGVWDEMVYAVPLARLQNLPPRCSIVHLEMVNVFVALNLWKLRLAGKSLIIHCDNAAVVSTLNSGRAFDQFLLKVARNIWLLTAVHDIDLQVRHIPGKKNVVADTLSRWFSGRIDNLTVHKFASFRWCTVQATDLAVDDTI